MLLLKRADSMLSSNSLEGFFFLPCKKCVPLLFLLFSLLLCCNLLLLCLELYPEVNIILLYRFYSLSAGETCSRALDRTMGEALIMLGTELYEMGETAWHTAVLNGRDMLATEPC